MSDGFETREFVAGFLAEAHEHLASANANLLAMDEAARRDVPHPRAVRELFRSLHTLKGLSAMIGAEPIVDVAHEMEALLRSADQAGGRLAPDAVDVLLQGVKAIEARVANLARGERVADAPEPLVHALASLQRPRGAAPAGELSLPNEILAKLAPADREELLRGVAAGRRARRVDFVPSPERAAQGLSITTVRERVGAVGDIVKVLPRAAAPGEVAPAGLAFVLLVLTDADDVRLAEAAAADVASVREIAAAPAAPAVHDPIEDEPSEEAGVQPRRFVRVDVRRLDDALERLSTLVVTRSRLQLAAAALARSGADVRELTAVLGENARQLRDLRAAIMSARMVAVSELLERAPLIVRGLSQSTGKPVKLTVDAGQAELDKAVGERIFPAIVHLLRNAVDHAIEPPDERRRAGKPEEGRIRVSCRERSDTQLELVVEDDGRGIDREAVARRAGVPVPRSDAELLDLIARPGLSTVEQATRTSGRGVGMDVVKRVTVAELGGELLLETHPGAGTRFTLRVPLSVSIVDAFTFACGDEVFVVPVTAVEDLVEIERADVVETPDPAHRGADVRLLRRRGETLPLVRLDRLLGVTAAATARPKAIVVRRDGDGWALQVDRLIGQQEIVVRPLADPLVQVAGVAGTTDLGDGRPTLVLDLAALTRAAGAPRREVA
jgi:two-component system, chemotaxis family, sensor kinase CheA